MKKTRSVARSTMGYTSRLAAKDASALGVMRELAGQYPRYGYRKIRIFLERRGHAISSERAYRLWRAAGLQVPRRRPRRRAATSRPRPLPASGPNQVWAYDFVFDTCADGTSLKCLTVVDEFTRECLAIDVARSIRSSRVLEVLTQLVSLHGAPRYLRSDNGREFVATAILRWLQAVGIETAFIDPGKPWQNGTDESFNGKFRTECLTVEWFGIGWRPASPSSSVAVTTMRNGPYEPRRSDARRVQNQDQRQPGWKGFGGRCSPIISGPNNPGRSRSSNCSRFFRRRPVLMKRSISVLFPTTCRSCSTQLGMRPPRRELSDVMAG